MFLVRFDSNSRTHPHKHKAPHRFKTLFLCLPICFLPFLFWGFVIIFWELKNRDEEEEEDLKLLLWGVFMRLC
ncbi:hypothetical protein L2E82_25928 [Cichorium intybus]|uniref:Uncharacterized protein n=1 Tax=Cichorium intybus TaxID=13427 RepID=A0ACB9E4F6_CICIN|nr:hypothetical protein L2E82_25928 [Cichorium intybus]